MDSGEEPIAVLAGGHAAEHRISLLSGAALVAALARRGQRVLPVLITRERVWRILGDLPPQEGGFRFPEELPASLEGGEEQGSGGAMAARLKQRGVRAVLLGVHGKWAEDGTLQGLLEWAGLPYSGPGPGSSALASDKGIFKRLLQGEGLRTPEFLEFSRQEWLQDQEREIVEEILEAFSLPLVVKPVSLGSSVGTTIVRREEGLQQALAAALTLDQHCLVEAFVKGREFTCAVLGDAEQPETFPVIEIEPCRANWFDEASKYEAGGARELVPARIGSELEDELRREAACIHELIRAHGTTRTDFLVDEEGHVWVLETNTLPGMSSGSLFPKAVASVGWSMEDLVGELLRLAFKKAERTRESEP